MIANTLPQSIIDNPLLSQWIAFEEQGCVRFSTGKVEIGQGAVTALAQIAAEELDIAMRQLRIVSGETGVSPSEKFTTGSDTIAYSGAAVRLVCAEVRALMVDRAADKLGCDATELSIDDGRVLRAGEDTGLDYWALAREVDLARPATGSAPTKLPSQYRIVGTNVPLLDLPAKVLGPAFLHDIIPDNVLHARVLRRPWRGARLVSLDEAAVRRAAGGALEIIRDGDFLAVTSDDETVAMRAAQAARERAVWNGGEPMAADMNEVAWLKAQRSRDRVVETVAPAARAGKAVPIEGGRVVEARFSRPFLAYASIGPSCALAEFTDNHLKVWSHTQGPYVLRDWLARALSLSTDRVTVFHRQGAGCYGQNSADDVAFDAAYLATRVPGRAVRVMFSREDEFLAGPMSAAGAVEIKAVLDARQRPVDWTIEIWSPVHIARPSTNNYHGFPGAEARANAPPRPAELADTADATGGGATRNAHAAYDFPVHRLIHHTLGEVAVRTASMRALGAYANVFAIESFIDDLADLAGEDPVAYRLSLLSDPRARAVIERVAEMSGWRDQAQHGEGRGKGLGFARYKNRAAYVALVAEVEIDESVRVTRVWGAVDAGLVINPSGAANQVEGGIIQATSWTLKEQVRFHGGRVASLTWEDYPILAFSEVPEIELAFLDSPQQPTLGLGEVSAGPTAAAIGNAVARALGTRIRDLPLTRERIMEALLE